MIRIGLDPLQVLSSFGAKAGDVRRAMEIAARRKDELMTAWKKHHG